MSILTITQEIVENCLLEWNLSLNERELRYDIGDKIDQIEEIISPGPSDDSEEKIALLTILIYIHIKEGTFINPKSFNNRKPSDPLEPMYAMTSRIRELFAAHERDLSKESYRKIQELLKKPEAKTGVPVVKNENES